MRKLLMVLLTISLFGCNSVQKNYEMKSEMNTLYPIEIIYFDGKTEAAIGEFPINRSIYGDIIEIIEKDNPKYIILKFMFESKKYEDAELANTLIKYNNILTETTTSLVPIEENKNEAIIANSLNISTNLPIEKDMILPNNTLINGFSGIGLADVIVSNEEFMDYSLIKNVRGFTIPSLALLIATKEFETPVSYNTDSISIGNSLLIIKNGNYRIDLSEPKSLYPEYSMIDILEDNDEHYFENKIIIIFIDIPATRNYKSDYSTLHNGAEIIADSINTILKEID